MKVVVNKLDKSWNVYLKNPKPIKVEVIKELKIVCDKGIVDVSTIKLTFSYDNVDKVDVVNAVKSYILDLIKNSPSLGSLEESEIIIENNKINIEVTNKFEESVIEKESENIKFKITGNQELPASRRIHHQLRLSMASRSSVRPRRIS